MLERIFHPVGQGAFYSERHEGFNMVYDCGTSYVNVNKKSITQIVSKSFAKDVAIDILFISHFDFDHVSKISALFKRKKGEADRKIHKVVLPLLHEKEKNILINLYRILDGNILKLIENPQRFFGDDTVIIMVEPTKSHNEEIDGERLYIDDINKSRKIKSGTKLLKKNLDWLYIPYNHEYTSRHQILEEKLKEKNLDLDINKLKKNPKFSLDEIFIEKRKEIKKVYTELEGNINQNSMVVYSGPASTNKRFSKKSYHYSSKFYNENFEFVSRVACVYTGDSNLNIIDITAIFKSYWKNVGTIQVPHHGDMSSFNENVLQNKNYCCPVSVGNNNIYGHPSVGLKSKILKYDSYPYLVTEDLNSEYIELISLEKSTLPSWVVYQIQQKNISEINKYQQYLLTTITKWKKDKENYECLLRYKKLEDLCKDKTIDICFRKVKVYT